MPVPLTTSVKPPLPAVTLSGETEDMDGAGLSLSTSITAPFDRPPPGAGFCTVTVTVPAAPRFEVATSAVSSVAVTNVVGRAWLFQRTVDPSSKFAPSTVSVNAAPPTVALTGDRFEIEGTGFEGGSPGIIRAQPNTRRLRAHAIATSKLFRVRGIGLINLCSSVSRQGLGR